MVTEKKENNKSTSLSLSLSLYIYIYIYIIYIYIPRAYPDKNTPDIDFIELVVECNVPVVNNTFLKDRIIQIIKIFT